MTEISAPEANNVVLEQYVSITNDVVSTADLAHPISIHVDLSKIAVGEEFTVWVKVFVREKNELTPEGTYSVWTAELREGVWTGAIALEQPPETASAPEIIMDADGTILTAWSQLDADNYPWHAIWVTGKSPGNDS
ncbi:MAG: hypothetical protein QNJ14_19255 [Woeseiaceae bacterium]|nr:hypothetical protein [Woeseiaceae bacterium]